MAREVDEERTTALAQEQNSKPKNRKERRLDAKQNGTPISAPTTQPKIKLAQPDRSGPQTKTLLQIYDEKKELLSKGQPFEEQSQSHSMTSTGNILDVGLGDNEPIGPFGDAVFWSICLTMFHFTLDVLVYNQYAQEILWDAIFRRSGTVLPILFLVVFMGRSELAMKLGIVRQILFFAVGTGAGCYLIHAGNTADYFAVMKQAPPLGAVWVYAVIEMDLPFAVASVLFDLGFLLWNGYSLF
ncbi:hypothetical protein CLAFUW4_03751 [Fulvia fulva]|uniref:DUF7719 domain-containing protein n=1 Tax=Passalora fulva TaxID=5499 RepID=A0A9Q8P4W8_PASFU|nr:uncharacterized protein CLAFUR5_03726 [Fulvia fulva]UJO13530.1 hypothetical protein CLAFUR5_03726 [Fulvia fulva]WPV11784.1 hypothetical protein CLAFUW4_03751 [Fulvia fulva]